MENKAKQKWFWVIYGDRANQLHCEKSIFVNSFFIENLTQYQMYQIKRNYLSRNCLVIAI